MVSCEKFRTSDRTAVEEQYLEDRRSRGFTSAPSADPVNHPPHYNNSNAKCECGRTIQCIDITRHLNFNTGNAIKYLWRCEMKGNKLQDLMKAAWYIQDEISKMEKVR
jgi:hypothetical protein